MKHLVSGLLCAIGLMVMSAACGSDTTDTVDCSGGALSCGCKGAGCTCCPSDHPYWCVDESGTATCLATMGDSSGNCLSDVISCH